MENSICKYIRRLGPFKVGGRIRRTLGDIDPLNKVPFKRATSRVQKDPLYGVSLILPRTRASKASSGLRALGFGGFGAP